MLWLAAYLSLALLMWATSLGLQDHFLTERALYDLKLSLHGDTPFDWSMDDPRDITRSNRHGIEEITFDKGIASFSALEDDTYFSLNLRGRLIDAAAFTRLSIRIHASAESELQVIHQFLDGGFNAHGTARTFKLIRGWQTVRINLAAERYLLSRDRQNPPPDSHLLQWGGRENIVTGLRLDPAQKRGVDFAVDWVKLQRSAALQTSGLAANLEELSDAHNLSVDQRQQIWNRLIAAAGSGMGPPIVTDTAVVRLPQLSANLREQVLRNSPQAIFLPNAALPDLRRLGSRQELSNPVSGHQEQLSFTAVFAVAAILLWGYRRGSPDTRREAQTLLSACLVLSLFLWLTADEVLTAEFAIPATILVLLGVYAVSLNPGHGLAKAGLGPGSMRAWIETGYCSLIPLLIVLATWLVYADTIVNWSLLWKTLITYSLWGLVQQLILCTILANLLLSILTDEPDSPSVYRRQVVALLAGAVFSILHAPNLTLMLATLCLGPLWANLFIKHRTIIPLALSHGLLGGLFQLLAPTALRINGSVGLAHFNWLW